MAKAKVDSWSPWRGPDSQQHENDITDPLDRNTLDKLHSEYYKEESYRHVLDKWFSKIPNRAAVAITFAQLTLHERKIVPGETIKFRRQMLSQMQKLLAQMQACEIAACLTPLYSATNLEEREEAKRFYCEYLHIIEGLDIRIVKLKSVDGSVSTGGRHVDRTKRDGLAMLAVLGESAGFTEWEIGKDLQNSVYAHLKTPPSVDTLYRSLSASYQRVGNDIANSIAAPQLPK